MARESLSLKFETAASYMGFAASMYKNPLKSMGFRHACTRNLRRHWICQHACSKALEKLAFAAMCKKHRNILEWPSMHTLKTLQAMEYSSTQALKTLENLATYKHVCYESWTMSDGLEGRHWMTWEISACKHAYRTILENIGIFSMYTSKDIGFKYSDHSRCTMKTTGNE